MIKIRGKKAQVFTLVAISIITLLFVSFSIYSTLRTRDSINERVKTMDSFLFSLEEDLERQMYIVGYRLIVMTQAEIEEGNGPHLNPDGYITNIDNVLQDKFFDESDIDETDLFFGVRKIDLMEKNQDSVNIKAKKMNLQINTTKFDISITQDDPWNIKIIFQFDLVMDDESGLARWDKREDITAEIPIANFYDPFYMRNTNNFGSKMRRAPNCTTASPASPNPCIEIVGTDEIIRGDKLKYAQSGNYSQHDDAPSFLDRLHGRYISGGDTGVERLIDVSAPEIPDILRSANSGKSIVDYIYFSPLNPTSCITDEFPSVSWFKIDNNHRDKYGITPLSCP